MNQRTGTGYAASLVAAALAVAAASSWRGLIVSPGRYLVPLALGCALVALTGATARRYRQRWYVVLALELLVLTVWLQHRSAGSGPLGGWLPTPDALTRLVDQVREGASAVNNYAAPVTAGHANADLYLLVAGLGVALLIDLLACGLQLPAWTGLPVLVTVTIPISVLDGGLTTPSYVATGLLFALLLAVIEADRAVHWGQAVDGRSDSSEPRRGRRAGARGALGVRAVGIAIAATAFALVASLAVPVGDGLFRDDANGTGGDGDGAVSLTNPLVDLRRDLIANNHLPLLDAATDTGDPSYVRLTVLDQFDHGTWTPSTRHLAVSNDAKGQLPAPQGSSPGRPGTESVWQLRTTNAFSTTWLPTPFPTRSISIDKGDWRYDPTLLDIVSVSDPVPTAISYRLVAFAPKITAADLERAPAPPPGIVATMTDLPTLPPVVATLADQITSRGTTEYAKAVLLQDWFRSQGGFSYSLVPASGGGTDQLVRFLTTDKVGYCEQFAAAMALMARSVDLPARVVVGFLGPSKRSGGRYRYTSDDLHAWPEIFFSGFGWVRFEPTPSSRTGSAPAWAQSNIQGGPTIPSQTPTSAVPEPRPKPAPEPRTEVEADDASGTVPWLTLVGAGLVVLLALGAPGAARARQRVRRLRPDPDPRTDVEGLWEELAATAIDLGLPWPEGRSPRTIAETVRRSVAPSTVDPKSRADAEALDELVTLVERARYSGQFVLDSDDRSAAVDAVHRWSARMTSSVSRSRARLALIAPRSLISTPDGPTPVGTSSGNELTGVGQ